MTKEEKPNPFYGMDFDAALKKVSTTDASTRSISTGSDRQTASDHDDPVEVADGVWLKPLHDHTPRIDKSQIEAFERLAREEYQKLVQGSKS
jgi:hypothetical protein